VPATIAPTIRAPT
ncbi:hypothetical protein A2U01_0105830, partial [Trifolium medium]|nr:hypothetical protein [Trifolium medium]